MSVTNLTIFDVLDRAAVDREFLARLAAAPLETAANLGVEIHPGEWKLILGIPGATDEDLIEVLRNRIRLPDSGCNPCDEDCTTAE